MTLELRDTSGTPIIAMTNDQETLAFYGPQPGYTIHVVDSNPSSMFSEFEDVSKVEKYEISEESYAKRDDTFRKFKEERQKVDPNFMKSTQTKIGEDFQKEESEAIAVGNRCELIIG